MLPRRHNHQRARILVMLSTGREITTRDVAAECHMALRNAIHYMREIHEDGEAHIGRWLPYAVPVYRYGPGVDAPRPARKTSGVKNKEADARQKRIARARKRFTDYTAIKSVVAFSFGVAA